MGVRRFDLAAGGDTFDFDAGTEEKIAFWLSKYPDERKRSAVIPLLWLAQKDNKGWLSEPAMREVAERLEMPYIRVYEVATFYTMFRLKPVGTHHVQLCGTTPCMLRGANDLKEVCERKIGSKEQVSETGRLSWEEVECLGACVNAPIVQINDYYYEDLTPESFEEILGKLDSGVEVQPGNFIARECSAPEGDAITLINPAINDGSIPSGLTRLPNLPDEKRPLAELKDVGGRATVEIVDLGPADFVKPEALEAPENGAADDLKRISGVGPVLEKKLNSLGIFHFHQIAKWGRNEIAWIDDYLSFKGRVEREEWIPQAIKLAEEQS